MQFTDTLTKRNKDIDRTEKATSLVKSIATPLHDSRPTVSLAENASPRQRLKLQSNRFVFVSSAGIEIRAYSYSSTVC